MGTLSLRLPESLHKKVKELSKKEDVSMNQLITLVVSEKMSALLTLDYLKDRAKKGSKESFENIMDSVPDIEPEDYDKL